MKFAAVAGLGALPSLAHAHGLWSLFPKPSFKPAGAAYFLTNEANGNYIVSSAIGFDGKLTTGEAVWTGGIGANGDIGKPQPGPDPLFSQGAITVSGQKLYSINPGSNTVVAFDIDPSDPTKLSLIGQPVSSGGEFPVSVTVSKKGQVCVLNGGKVNGVSCFKQNGAAGLAPIPNTTRSLGLNQTTPAAGPPNSVSQVVFNEAQDKLIAAVKGVPPTPGFLAVWDVDAKTGALSETFKKVPLPQGGLLPFSITPIPGKNSILVSDAGIGYEIFDFTHNTSAAYAIANQSAICWSTFSKKTGNYYIIDSGSNIISELKLDSKNPVKSSTVKQYPLPAGSILLDADVASVFGKDYMYVLAVGHQSIQVLSLSGPGKANLVQEYAFANSLAKSAIKSDVFALVGMATYVP